MVTVVRWEHLCILMECKIPPERAFQGSVEAPAQNHILMQVQSVQPAWISLETRNNLHRSCHKEQEWSWIPELIDFMQTPVKTSLGSFYNSLQASTELLTQDPICAGVLCLQTPGNNSCRNFITAAIENGVRKEVVKGCFQAWCNPTGVRQTQTPPCLCTTNCSLYSTCDMSEITNSLKQQF